MLLVKSQVDFQKIAESGASVVAMRKNITGSNIYGIGIDFFDKKGYNVEKSSSERVI